MNFSYYGWKMNGDGWVSYIYDDVGNDVGDNMLVMMLEIPFMTPRWIF
jgi:hypothetical protein